MTTASPVLENQLQHDRTARALSALQCGQMQVTVLNDCTWMIASKGRRYTVSIDGDAWVCTCPDFVGRCIRFGLRCKHIEAVRLTGTIKIAESGLESLYTYPQFSKIHTEESMTQSMPTPQPPTVDQSSEQILRRLRQPLDMTRVKRRQAPGKGTVPYLGGYDVIEAANDLFLFRWSFDLLSEPHIIRWDKAVTFYDQRLKKKVPVLGEDDNPTTEIAGVAYVTGRITVELGGKAYNHADVGRCIFTGDTPEALDMAIAGSVTDCLKRCFRQLGEQFGNSLYDKEIARTAGLQKDASSYSDNGGGTTRNGGAHREAIQDTQRKTSTPSTIQPDVLLYQDGSAVFMNNLSEVSAFNAYKAAHDGRVPASRDALRAWSNGRKGKR
jgi:predicted nucleic acid-binding Zn finger protein